MLLQCCCWSLSSAQISSSVFTSHSSSVKLKHHYTRQPFLLLLPLRKPKKASPFNFNCLLPDLFDQFSQLPHNKVLIAAGVSAAIGQLSKPFTSVLLYGKDFDFKDALQAGGFPSTHSSAVVATATIIGFERGFSDSIFGLTVVYAGLVMYDAQGVRREVGNHAKVLNKVLAKIHNNSVQIKDRIDLIDSQPGTSSPLNLESLGPLLSEEASSFTSKPTNSPLLLRSDEKMRQTKQAVLSSGLAADVEEGSERATNNLKQSIGHTEVEVIAGALLGFFVSLAVCTVL